MIMTIGSGDVSSLLAGKQTAAYASLWQKFVSEHRPNWNSLASPIDPLRTGAVLEQRFVSVLEDHYTQWKSTSEELDCLTSSIDFAKLESGKVVDFVELKTIWFTEFISNISQHRGGGGLEMVKKHFKANYHQVQFQLLTTGLESAKIAFLAVYTYDDELNMVRDIYEEDFVMIDVHRDESVIGRIKEEATIFQKVKDHACKKK